MKRETTQFEDDGRVIADMGEILPEEREAPWETSMSRRERLLTVFGAMGASLLIGIIYLAAFAAVIALMIHFFR